jgi:hypothetical protein
MMIYHGRVIGPAGQVYQCEHNHRTETAAITCANSAATRRMAAMVWQRAAAQAARQAALAKQRAEEREAARARRIAAQEAAEARRAAARAARDQAKAAKRAAKLAAMSPERAWKRMTPDERLLRTADLEMQSYGEIRSPEALAAYQAGAAKQAQAEVPASSNSAGSVDSSSGVAQSGGRAKVLNQHKAEAKKTLGQAIGGLLVILAILGVIILVVVQVVHFGPSGPALVIMKKIPGCTNITTDGGGSLDDNTISEGSCQLADGTNVNVYVWMAGDITDQHDYVYQNASNCTASSSSVFPVPDGCFVGNNPRLWFIDVATGSFLSRSGAESDWTPIENALAVTPVTKVPASWCSTICPVPGQSSGGDGFSFGDGD